MVDWFPRGWICNKPTPHDVSSDDEHSWDRYSFYFLLTVVSCIAAQVVEMAIFFLHVSTWHTCWVPLRKKVFLTWVQCVYINTVDVLISLAFHRGLRVFKWISISYNNYKIYLSAVVTDLRSKELIRVFSAEHIDFGINSLRPSDAYMRQ